MKTEYWLKDWQHKSVNAFIDRFGLDACAKMLVEFEKHGSLGKAMIKIAHAENATNCQRTT